MDFLFWLVLILLSLGVGGSLYGFGEWFYHGRRNLPILLWSVGLLGLNWYQVPTLIALSSKSAVVLSNFNPLFSLALPVAFLGFELIYLGGLFTISKVKRQTVISLTAWFVASVLYYGFYYRMGETFQTVWPVLGSNLLFFAPIFALNLSAAVAMHRRAVLSGNRRHKLGALLYAFASCCGLARTGLSLFFGLVYPPQFAALRFFSPSFIVAQLAGLAIFLLSFWLLHKDGK